MICNAALPTSPSKIASGTVFSASVSVQGIQARKCTVAIGAGKRSFARV